MLTTWPRGPRKVKGVKVPTIKAISYPAGAFKRLELKTVDGRDFERTALNRKQWLEKYGTLPYGVL